MNTPTPDLIEAGAGELFAAHKRFWLGCFQAEVIVDTFLWCALHPHTADGSGVFTVQLTQYWEWQSKDRLWTRVVVSATAVLVYFVTGGWVLWERELTPGFILYNCSYNFVENYGLYAHFLNGSILSWYAIFNALTCVTTQGFFAHRAFHLTNRNYFILALVWVCILTTLAATIAIRILEHEGYSLDSHKIRVPAILYMSTTVCADSILTMAILYCLFNSKTGWDSTDKVIMRLVRLTIESQLPPSILAIVTLATFCSFPDPALATMMQVIQSKFYCIGLMYSLNKRIKFTPQTMETATGQVFMLNPNGLATIKVDVETETYETRVEYLPAGPNRSKLNTLQMGDGGEGTSFDATDKASAATVATLARSEKEGSAHEVEVLDRLERAGCTTPPVGVQADIL
ncbi:hypothetical protein Q8F55_007715 [Vanrija albida]|uniref:DUF6534 domain-containing protein n=1 Tax=Vanrija albida TaxID=181172 RepID=A0ABR3PUA7_9TREE